MLGLLIDSGLRSIRKAKRIQKDYIDRSDIPTLDLQGTPVNFVEISEADKISANSAPCSDELCKIMPDVRLKPQVRKRLLAWY